MLRKLLLFLLLAVPAFAGDVSTWSPTAANNNSTPPNGAPEGMAASAVNNVIRENMAATRRAFEQMPWTNFGHAPTYVSTASFTTPGTLATVIFDDQTYANVYAVGNKLRIKDGSSWKYVTISAVSDSSGAGPVLVTFTGNTITNSISAVSVHSVSIFKNVLDEYALTASIIQGYTGETRFGFFSVASVPSGWIAYTEGGSIGNAGSGATIRANADTEALYTLFWNGVADTYATVSTGRGASAAADFAAGKKLTLPPLAGRSLAITGSGSGLTAGRALGSNTGTETETLTVNQMPAHRHSMYSSNDDAGASGGGAGWGVSISYDTPSIPSGSVGKRTGIMESVGGGQAHNNMQPTTFVNCMIKL